MALVAFLRGVNVGGHKTFRPSLLAQELSDYDVASVGAAGSFVIRKPGPQAKFRSELIRRLPFDAEVIVCRGVDLLQLERLDPFASEPARPEIVRFVTVLPGANCARAAVPIALPADGEWLVRIIGAKGRFVFGVYRRHLQTIRYLGQMDRLFGTPVTTRNWNTILALVDVLKRGSAR